MNVLVKRTDLARNSFCTHGGFHRTAIAVANHEGYFNAQYGRSVFETGDGCRRCEVPRNAHHEEMADCLVEDQLDRYPRISTRQDGSKRLLFFNRIGPQYLQILLQ